MSSRQRAGLPTGSLLDLDFDSANPLGNKVIYKGPDDAKDEPHDRIEDGHQEGEAGAQSHDADALLILEMGRNQGDYQEDRTEEQAHDSVGEGHHLAELERGDPLDSSRDRELRWDWVHRLIGLGIAGAARRCGKEQREARV